jgi:hypothetical protein
VPPTDEPRPKMSKKIKIVISVLLVAVILGAALVLLLPKAAGKSINDAIVVSDQAVNHLQNKNSSALYGLATDSFKNATSMDQLNELLNSASQQLQGEEKVFAHKMLSNNGISVAAVVYNIPTSSGTKYVRIVLQKEGDAWRVINFRYADTPLDTTIE